MSEELLAISNSISVVDRATCKVNPFLYHPKMVYILAEPVTNYGMGQCASF
jgi:hypothetical protein